MSLIVVSYVGLYIVGLTAIVTIGLPVIRLIKPDSTPTVTVMLGVGLYQFLLKFRNCYASYFSCTNRIPYMWSFILSSTSCVLLAALMLQMGAGVWGLIFAQIISQSAFNAWYWARKAHREMQLSPGEMARLGFGESKKVLSGFFGRK